MGCRFMVVLRFISLLRMLNATIVLELLRQDRARRPIGQKSVLFVLKAIVTPARGVSTNLAVAPRVTHERESRSAIAVLNHTKLYTTGDLPL